MVIYISKEQAIEVHRKTIEYSGGGDYGIINIGFLYSALEHIQNDDYYPLFEDKLVHLIWSINRNHSFSDGNKRTARITSNAILMAWGYCPLSFRTVDSVDYKKAMLMFYEQNNIAAFKQIFIEQYEFATKNYF